MTARPNAKWRIFTRPLNLRYPSIPAYAYNDFYVFTDSHQLSSVFQTGTTTEFQRNADLRCYKSNQIMLCISQTDRISTKEQKQWSIDAELCQVPISMIVSDTVIGISSR